MANLLGRFVGLGDPISLDLCETPAGHSMAGRLAGQRLPAADRDVDIMGVNFECVSNASGALRSD